MSQLIGIDISHHQAAMDIASMKKQGVQFCILKATQGPRDFLDPQFRIRWVKLQGSGIIRGAYHFFEASQNGETQARFFLESIKAAGGLLPGDLPVCNDWESDRYYPKYPIVSFKTQLSNAQKFMDIVESETGHAPLFYTGRHRLVENRYPDSWTKYPLWECDYVGGLDVVKPYTKVAIWQKSDNAKRDASLPMGGDFNIFQGNKDDLKALLIGAGSPIPASAPAPIAEQSDRLALLSLAKAAGRDFAALAQITHMVDVRDLKNPDSRPRFWAEVDMRIHSSKNRMFIYDLQAKTVQQIRVAHGKGSDPKNDGFLDFFSNVSGSNCSSSGVYRVGETYDGKHGLSARLDGLEPTNSNARNRSVVLHGADYVEDAWVGKNGRAGRSDGCLAVSDSIHEDVVKKLHGGSFVVSHKG